MPSYQVNRWASAATALALCLAALASAAPAARALGAPAIGESWSSAVFSSSARLNAEIDPNELPSTYHFDYITEAAYAANLGAGEDGFSGALKAPALIEAKLTPGGAPSVTQLVFGLTPETSYRYRVVAENSAGAAAPSEIHTFITQSLGGGSLLPDSRGWEMVSPVDKNGGQAEPAGAIAGGGVLQAAIAGGAVTYGSTASFGAGAAGSPPASQYIARRSGGGWATENVTAPVFSGTYGTTDGGVPYQLFSADLARALLLNGEHCRGEGTGCAVANPPLAGTEAPAGYQNYYLRQSAGASFAALLSATDVAGLGLDPANFDLRFAGASPDLGHVVLSTCAALTPDAIEVPLAQGCDPAKANLYQWSSGTGLSLINLLPGQSQGEPGAELAAQSTAISANGARVYWQDSAGDLYLREAGETELLETAAAFQTASTDGAKALYTKGGHLFSYDATTQASTDLTPAGGVVGVLGASADGASVYYQDAGALKLSVGGTSTTVAPGAAAASNYPPSTGSARVSADGAHLLFLSSASLTGYDNADQGTGLPDSQAYLYGAGAGSLTCVSCNPTEQRPIGPSSIPGAIANGSAPGSTEAYKPRVLSADGRRVFFESRDAIAVTDTNAGAPDVYQWEAQGKGSCTRAGGCIALISSGRSPKGATFVDASADGSDAFFITDASLVGADIGAIDLYDARVGGGFPEPPPPIPCEGDACQFLPPEPVDPTLTTLLRGPGNPKVRYQDRKRCKKGSVRRKGKCVPKKRPNRGRRNRGGSR